jgi:nucleotide-binding universal stress UspA family protein
MTWVDPRAKPEVPSIDRVVILFDDRHPHLTAATMGADVANALAARSLLVTPDEISSTERPPSRHRAEEARTTRDAENLLAGAGATADEVRVVFGDLDDELAGLVGEHDLVVVGTADVVGTTSLALGAEAHSLARTLECPLLVVPDSTSASSGPIVVGVGGHSEDELRALAWADTMGRALHRDVVAVHAVDPMYETFGNAGDFGDDERLSRRMAKEAGVTLVERFGYPEEVCRMTVAETQASMLVVSAKHRGSLGGRLLGGITDALLHEPPVPLAIITHEYSEQS